MSNFDDLPDISGDPEGEMIDVVSPSGAQFAVMTDGEKRYFEKVASDYTNDNRFTNISYVRELDRILV